MAQLLNKQIPSLIISPMTKQDAEMLWRQESGFSYETTAKYFKNADVSKSW